MLIALDGCRWSIARPTRAIGSLIEAFRGITGIPIVLNTSFNENEPIVCRPEEALDCFLRTSMDALVLGYTFIWRND
jgi:carbamoyltransferase